MTTKRTPPWASSCKKVGTLGLVAVLAGASSGSFRDLAPADQKVIPSIPDRAFEQPATVQPAVELMASPQTTVPAVAAVSNDDIPARALFAYKRAETLLADSDAPCKLSWTLLAAIGRVESNHGRTNGNTLDAAGVSRPGVYGVPLNGSNTATIKDTDGGKIDRDTSWDRAVGPMQFIPGTWKSVAIDSDNDGIADPQNIVDAAASAGVYLCAGSEDLSTDAGARAAVLRYNHSSAYVDKVLAIASQYARGDFSDEIIAAPPAVQKLPTPAKSKAPTVKPEPEPKPEAPKPETPPVTEPPVTEPPVTEPPVTEPPVTEPPVTEPPVTEPPVTEPPVTEPPVTEPPVEPPVEPPTAPPPFTGTEAEALALCTATGNYQPDSDELRQCVVTLMDTGFLPAPPAP